MIFIKKKLSLNMNDWIIIINAFFVIMRIMYIKSLIDIFNKLSTYCDDVCEAFVCNKSKSGLHFLEF